MFCGIFTNFFSPQGKFLLFCEAEIEGEVDDFTLCLFSTSRAIVDFIRFIIFIFSFDIRIHFFSRFACNMKFETKEIRKEKKSNFTRNRKSVVRSKLFISFSTSISLPLHLSPFFVTSSIIVHCPASPHDPTSQLPFVMIASSPNPSRPHCCSPRVGHPPVGTGRFQVNGGREVLKKRLSFDVLFFFEN